MVSNLLQKHRSQEDAAEPGRFGCGSIGHIWLERRNAQEPSPLVRALADPKGEVLKAGEAGVNKDGGGERVPGEVEASGDGIGLSAEKFDGQPGGRVQAERFQAFKVAEGDWNLVGCVEADESERPTGIEDGFEGERIEKGVPLRLGGSRNVAGCVERTAHPDEVADGPAKTRLFAEGDREIGQRAEGEDIEGRSVQETAFQVGGGGFGLGRWMRGRQLAEELAGGSAPLGGKGGGSFERLRGADVDGNTRTVAISKETSDGLGASGGLGEAVDDGDGFNPDVRPLEQEQQGQEVVGAGVGIDEYGVRGLSTRLGTQFGTKSSG